MKSSDKELRLTARNLSDLYLDMLAANIFPIFVSASVRTPKWSILECRPCQILQLIYKLFIPLPFPLPSLQSFPFHPPPPPLPLPSSKKNYKLLMLLCGTPDQCFHVMEIIHETYKNKLKFHVSSIVICNSLKTGISCLSFSCFTDKLSDDIQFIRCQL